MITHKKTYLPSYKNFVMFPLSWKDTNDKRLLPYQIFLNVNGKRYNEYNAENWI